jgi:hypothetical protein
MKMIKEEEIIEGKGESTSDNDSYNGNTIYKRKVRMVI